MDPDSIKQPADNYEATDEEIPRRVLEFNSEHAE
jgi:hypothetical protein